MEYYLEFLESAYFQYLLPFATKYRQKTFLPDFETNWLNLLDSFFLHFIDILNILILFVILFYFSIDLIRVKLNKVKMPHFFLISIPTKQLFFFKKYSFIFLFIYFSYLLILEYNLVKLNPTYPTILLGDYSSLPLNSIYPVFFVMELVATPFKKTFFFLSIASIISFLFYFSLTSNMVSKLYSTILEFRILYWLLFFFLINLIQVEGLIGFYIILEGSTLAFIILLLFFFTDSITKTSNQTFYDQKILESGGKYFCLSGLASIFLVIGICFIYGIVGCTSFIELSYYFNTIEIFFSLPLLIFTVSFLFASLLFKLSIFPCHFWTPDVYEGLDYGLLAILATVVKIIIFVLNLKFIYILFYPLLAYYNFYLYLFGTLSVLVGALSALSQTKIKRFLAYSSINQLGFFLLATLEGTYLGFLVSLFSLFIYSVTLIFFIYFLGNYTVLINYLPNQLKPLFRDKNISSLNTYYSVFSYFQYKSKQASRPLYYLTDLLLLWQKSPGIAFILVVLLCSWAGIPPFTGFFSKFGILGIIFTSPFSFWVFFFLIINAIPSYYYLRIIKIIFFDAKNPSLKQTPFVIFYNAVITRRTQNNLSFSLSTNTPLYGLILAFHLGFIFYYNSLWSIFTLIVDSVL
jgi:NADH-quinone oxidoreductase subunit N